MLAEGFRTGKNSVTTGLVVTEPPRKGYKSPCSAKE